RGVRVPEAAWGRAVRADAAGEGGEVEDELWLRVAEEACRVLLAREVVVGAARHDDLVAVTLQPLDEVRAEEPAAACDERRHSTGEGVATAQSTRPIQRARLAAYPAIVSP